MQEPDGPVVLFPCETKAGVMSVHWEDSEGEGARRRRLAGLDSALRGAGTGYRNGDTKTPLREEDLIRRERLFLELYFLDAPDLVDSAIRCVEPISQVGGRKRVDVQS
ncbi:MULTISPECIES: hypothetical protein [unclassified Streptomyces]|uniref:hypothetical protein n=1 Tax=unclassified Streptomyces TaxID=2593676 RepID=UPI00081B333C|nr:MULTISPECIES: hypothetical protein [unclassified Streptomyces]MYQ84255.1 hypothetical protein [Streptomyces sp. SID4936]SCD82791.1 hypothetical protein GA0115234_105134 [Streptomyces sp. DvalAA-43]